MNTTKLERRLLRSRSRCERYAKNKLILLRYKKRVTPVTREVSEGQIVLLLKLIKELKNLHGKILATFWF